MVRWIKTYIWNMKSQNKPIIMNWVTSIAYLSCILLAIFGIRKWETKENILKAGKCVGISSTGLNVSWMQQDKFNRAESLLRPSQSSPQNTNSCKISCWCTEGYCCLLSRDRKSLEIIKDLVSTQVSPDDIEGLLPVKKIAPKKTKAWQITQVCGSMRGQTCSQKWKNLNKKKRKELRRKQKLLKWKKTCNFYFQNAKMFLYVTR